MTPTTPSPRLRIPLFSHLTFHQPLHVSLFSNSRLFFLLVFFFCFLLESNSTKIFPAEYHVPFVSHSAQILPPIWKRRFVRSPFMHPTVTSFETARKSSKRRPNSDIDLSRVGVSRVSVLPPMVRSHSAAGTNNRKQGNRENGARPQQNSRHPQNPTKFYSGSRLPQHPLAIPSRNSPHVAPTTQKVLFQQHQNDQHSIAATEESIVVELESTTKRPKQNLRMQNHSAKDNNSEEKPASEKILTNFYDVLEAIGKTTEELQDILRKESISLDEFLGFIDKGKTKDEIFAFLKLSKPSKFYKKSSQKFINGNIYQPNSFSRNEYDNEGVNMDRQKVLSVFPFTEIVHEVPIERRKTYKNSFKHTTKSKYPEFLEKSQKKKVDYEKYSITKLNKKLKDRRVNEKSYKPKQKKYNPQEKNPFLMHSDGDPLSPLPPQDSPMVIPFLNQKRKDKDTKHSASIISLTVEEKKKNGIIIRSKGTPGPIPIRSMIITKQNTPKETSKEGLIASTFSDKEIRWKDHFYENQPSNLRLVFPMRGILLFCGALGIITIITILILIIYGTVKCNQKKVSENYEMSEHNNIEVAGS